MNTFLALIAILSVFGQTGDNGDTTTHEVELALTTRPKSLPLILKGRPLISVSEFATKKHPNLTRVFRYSFKADFEKFVNQLTETLRSWNKATEPGLVTFDRKVRLHNVEFQAFIIMHDRLTRDEPSPMHVKLTREPGWIRVSYNEAYTAKGP